MSEKRTVESQENKFKDKCLHHCKVHWKRRLKVASKPRKQKAVWSEKIEKLSCVSEQDIYEDCFTMLLDLSSNCYLHNLMFAF